MDDSCAVCAESLEWVAYGSCGHREVCSTCVVRLRFVLNDPRCCICKAESATVFVTKALGDYTRTINDFSAFPSDANEGRVGSYWYHEDTQSFFDDVDHYKMIKAMCKLSCSICDKQGDEQGNDGIKRRSKFQSIEQLKSHLYHRHRMLMCSLCLEGRKIFICEQKLYTRAQLNQHINTGDSEVDGSESERGGFMGHPMCEFCRNPFYGDNELYLHMSTEHYTCYMCQRQNPGQYEYYKNYDDLEIHFRHEHFLCEDEACLAKKFVVFLSESEMKRHNALEHGGHMSRSKRNAALQIPTSFRYRRSNAQDHRRGRGRGFHRESSDDQLSLAIEASFETATSDNSNHNFASGGQQDDNRETSEIDLGASLLESLTITPDSEPPSRYLQAVGQSSSNSRLEGSFFPPLPGASINGGQFVTRNSEVLGNSRQLTARDSEVLVGKRRQTATHDSELPGGNIMQSATRSLEVPGGNSRQLAMRNSEGPNRKSRQLVTSNLEVAGGNSRQLVTQNSEQPTWNTLAAHLRKKGSVTVLNSSQSQAWGTHGLVSSGSSSKMPGAFPALVSSNSTNTSQSREPVYGKASSSSSSSSQARPAFDHGCVMASSASSAWNSSSSSSSQARPATDHGRVIPSSASSSSNSSGSGRFPHSVSAPNLVDRGSLNSSMTNIVPASPSENKMRHESSQSKPNADAVHNANKSLVERIRSGLGHDEDKYTAFKEISLEYRQDLIDTGEYLSYVEQFGLSHLVLELARLCPDAQKQTALIRAYNASLQRIDSQEENGANNSARKKERKGSSKGKGKRVDGEDGGTKESLADSVIDTVRKLQENYKPSEDVEVLSKDGYRAGKGKSKLSLVAGQSQPSSVNRHSAELSGTEDSLSIGSGGSTKQRRKTSKFHRVRLGDGSISSLLDLKRMDASPERTEETTADVPSDSLPVRGVWRNGGGQKLVAMTQRDVTK